MSASLDEIRIAVNAERESIAKILDVVASQHRADAAATRDPVYRAACVLQAGDAEGVAAMVRARSLLPALAAAPLTSPRS